jgi:dTDP-4-dehydrorhamnose reductase
MGAITPQRILLTGGTGQLGYECQLAAPRGVQLSIPSRSELDLANPDSIRACVAGFRPEFILHCGAWTAVDAAEDNEVEALAVNEGGSRVLAEAAQKLGARLILVSTDYVFSGESSSPWRADAPVQPINAYGRSKLAAERAVQEVLGLQAQIVRTSWVYGRRGQNFVRTMLRLMQQGKPLRVVADQQGTPTWAGGLAHALWALATAPHAGPILHYSDAGQTTWYEFAVAIRKLALGLGLDMVDSTVDPCQTDEYPTPARRPFWSVMELSPDWKTLQVPPQPWLDTLSEALPLLIAEDKLTR